MRFERTGNVKKVLGIGPYQKLERGSYFYVRFRIRESSPRYYKFQEIERDGNSAHARAMEDERTLGSVYRNVRCIVNGIPHETFVAFWEDDEECWIIE